METAINLVYIFIFEFYIQIFLSVIRVITKLLVNSMIQVSLLNKIYT